MAIKTETTDKLIHTFSDAGFTILQTSTGIEYADAWDLKTNPQEYTETENPLEPENPETETEPEPVVES